MTDALTPFDALDQTLRESGPAAALAQLVAQLDEAGRYRALLEALLLQARYEIDLPLIVSGGLADVPEPVRSRYEERYVAAVRLVGQRFLATGDIAAAWPYFRALGEPEPVARALDDYHPDEGDERVGALIDLAFHQGANPCRGFELVLEHYGSCSAITAFEQLPRDEAVRSRCAAALVRQIHRHLAASLRADVEQRGGETLPDGLSIRAVLDGRGWLMDGEAYHIDVSHLASTVRVAPLLTGSEDLERALELAEYGRLLSPRHVYEGEPPFEDVYTDHRHYLLALLGRDVDAAIAHFRAKLTRPRGVEEGPDEMGRDTVPAQVLVGLLARVGRLDEAIEVAAEHLAGYPEPALLCPGLAQLCHRAGRYERLARHAREHDDPVHYAAALLQLRGGPSGPGHPSGCRTARAAEEDTTHETDDITRKRPVGPG